MKANATVSDYERWLDLETGHTGASWTSRGISYNRSSFCSYPDKACVYQAWSSTADNTTFGFNTVRPADQASQSMHHGEANRALTPPDITCVGDDTLSYRGFAEPNGMRYEIQVKCSTDGKLSCSAAQPGNATLLVTGAQSVTCALAGDTEYNIDAGTAAANYSFSGNPYHERVTGIIGDLDLDYDSMWQTHQADYQALYGGFELDLGATVQNASSTTQDLIDSFTIESGNVQLEQLM